MLWFVPRLLPQRKASLTAFCSRYAPHIPHGWSLPDRPREPCCTQATHVPGHRQRQSSMLPGLKSQHCEPSCSELKGGKVTPETIAWRLARMDHRPGVRGRLVCKPPSWGEKTQHTCHTHLDSLLVFLLPGGGWLTSRLYKGQLESTFSAHSISSLSS